MFRQNQGVTLIELLVVISIIAILTMVAVPSYNSYLRRTNRVDATAALMRVASMQEKYYVQNNSYATTAQLGPLATSEHGWYTIAITTAGTLVTDYTATATAVSSGKQNADTDCRRFTLTSTGVKSAFKSDSTANGTSCWR
jgi:type IV pilus assembly protein PilE